MWVMTRTWRQSFSGKNSLLLLRLVTSEATGDLWQGTPRRLFQLELTHQFGAKNLTNFAPILGALLLLHAGAGRFFGNITHLFLEAIQRCHVLVLNNQYNVPIVLVCRGRGPYLVRDNQAFLLCGLVHRFPLRLEELHVGVVAARQSADEGHFED